AIRWIVPAFPRRDLPASPTTSSSLSSISSPPSSSTILTISPPVSSSSLTIGLLSVSEIIPLSSTWHSINTPIVLIRLLGYGYLHFYLLHPLLSRHYLIMLSRRVSRAAFTAERILSLAHILSMTHLRAPSTLYFGYFIANHQSLRFLRPFAGRKRASRPFSIWKTQECLVLALMNLRYRYKLPQVFLTCGSLYLVHFKKGSLTGSHHDNSPPLF